MAMTPDSAGNFDEGLGTVYERFMLNNYFDSLMSSHRIKTTLEVPMRGMTGLTGINSVHLAKKGSHITLIDTDRGRSAEASKLWNMLRMEEKCEILCHKDLSNLPFNSGSFDLVWNFAAIWHVKNAGLMLDEMARVSSDLVLIFVPNRKQLGYPLRKYILDREFFNSVDESWIDLDRITARLKTHGMKVADEGVIDIPFWPDTAVPVKELLGMKPRKETAGTPGGFWKWDIMSYYRGDNPGLKNTIEKLAFLEKMPVPVKLKSLWAHHRYILYKKN